MKSNNIKVSVIVPVYNVEKYLEECLISLVNQTLDDIEIIVVNDGSPDNSQLIIDKYQEKYPKKIKSFIKENGGLGDTRNFGVKKANGEFIAFVDSDDYVDLDIFEKLYIKAKETNSEVVVYSLTYLNGFSIRKSYLAKTDCFGTSVKNNPNILLESRCIACNKLISKELWQKYNFKFPKIWFEDSAVIFNLLLVANKVECVNLPAYYYRESREGAITNTVSIKNTDMLTASDMALDFYKKHNDYEIVKDYINTILLKYIFSRLRFIKNCRYSKVTKEVIKKYKKYLDETFIFWKDEEFLSYKKGNFKRNFNNYMFRHLNVLRWYCFIPDFIKKIISLPAKALRSFKRLLKNIKNRKSSIKKELMEKENKRINIQKNGYNVLSEIMALFEENKITAFADFGTLLGFIREKQLLKHDLDMDIGVFVKDKNEINYVRMFLERHGFIVWREFYLDDKVVEMSCKYKAIKIDFNFYEVDNDKIYTWLFYKEDNKKYVGNYRDCVKMTYTNFKETKHIKIKNQDITIPKNPEKLLVEKYGENWTKPNKDWIYWKSPAATKLDKQGYFIQYKYENRS